MAPDKGNARAVQWGKNRSQPLALPNHIVGKGMMRPVKDGYEDVNIVAIDYIPEPRINQVNRLKLMLATAKRNMEKRTLENAAGLFFVVFNKLCM